VPLRRPAKCGDGKCDAPWETDGNCAADCASAVEPTCGDGSCDKGETCWQCPSDCGSCVADGKSGPKCGDGSCDDDETCASCPSDCGPCGGKDTVAKPDCGPWDICYDSGGGGGSNSCVGKCGQYGTGWQCQCDSQCEQYGDCCADKKQVCP